jgi:ribosome biogenesis protein Nip4
MGDNRKDLVLLRSLNAYKPELVQIVFNNSDRTAEKTQRFTITNINFLTLFKEINAVYLANHTEPVNTPCEKNVITHC